MTQLNISYHTHTEKRFDASKYQIMINAQISNLSRFISHKKNRMHGHHNKYTFDSPRTFIYYKSSSISSAFYIAKPSHFSIV